MKKLQNKKSTFSNQLSYRCGLEKATPELAARLAGSWKAILGTRPVVTRGLPRNVMQNLHVNM
jgi:hypothetical protein